MKNKENKKRKVEDEKEGIERKKKIAKIHERSRKGKHFWNESVKKDDII